MAQVPSGASSRANSAAHNASSTGSVLKWPYHALKSPSSTTRSERRILRHIDHLSDVRKRHVGTAGMQIGDYRDGELAAGGPARRRQRIARDNDAHRLDGAGIGRGRRCRKAEQGGAPCHKAPPRQPRLCRALALVGSVRCCRVHGRSGPRHSARVVNGLFIPEHRCSRRPSRLRDPLVRHPIERLVQRARQPVE